MLIDLSNTTQLDNTPRWHPLKEQSESIHHGRTHPPQGPGGSGGLGGQGGPGSQGGPGGPGGSGGQGGQPGNQQSPKTSVIKSRSHGIFPDPAKGRSSILNKNIQRNRTGGATSCIIPSKVLAL